MVSAAYGIQSIINTPELRHLLCAVCFAAIFLFSSYNMMPTAHNNHNAIMKRADRAESAMPSTSSLSRRNFPVPDIYAHPVVLSR
mgnify:CR=1 FL=1